MAEIKNEAVLRIMKHRGVSLCLCKWISWMTTRFCSSHTTKVQNTGSTALCRCSVFSGLRQVAIRVEAVYRLTSGGTRRIYETLEAQAGHIQQLREAL